MTSESDLEIEIKLRPTMGLAQVREQLLGDGFEISKPRVFESNTVLDTVDMKLREARELIRIRRVGEIAILTYKGEPQPGKHKSREELEVEVADAAKLESIFSRLGYSPMFRYDKFRTEFQKPGDKGIVTVDETPIGLYIELEGAPDWIDRTAQRMMFTERDYITQSYGSLYLEFCKEHGMVPAHMVFA